MPFKHNRYILLSYNYQGDEKMHKFELPQLTLDCFVDRIVTLYKDRPALAYQGEEPFTYQKFGYKINHLREILKELGFKKGDKIAILGKSSPNYGITFLAITTMGAIAVPIMEDFPESDIQHIIKHSESKAIFISESIFQEMNLPVIDENFYKFSLDTLKPIKSDDEGLWNKITEKASDIAHATTTKLHKAISDGINIFSKESNLIKEDDIAEILYTSGTTGHSKGVMLTHKNLVSNLFEGPDILGVINEQSVILSFLPMAHAFGLTSAFLSIIYCGASIIYLTKKPAPKILLNAMKEIRPTIIGGVPLIFEKIYQNKVKPVIQKNLIFKILASNNLTRKFLYKIIGKKILKSFGGRLECAIIGGAALSDEVEIFLRHGKIPYALGYGMTECSPLITFSAMGKAKIGSVGYAISDTEIKIIEQDPVTKVGEILVKGNGVMKGYYKNEKATNETFTVDGYLITGDKGYIDNDGFLFIKGRTKNVIIGASGENIYPEIIENILKKSLFVDEALVYMLDDKLTARIYPDYKYIESNVKNPSIANILEQIRKEVNTKLPGASRIVKVVEQTEPFIKTPTNKIKRGEYLSEY